MRDIDLTGAAVEPPEAHSCLSPARWPVVPITCRRSVGAMDFGVGYFPTHDAMGPGRSPGSSRSTARSRCSSPSTRTSRRAARPRTPGGGELPRKYWHTYDLFVALTAAAAATSRLRVGSGICLVDRARPDHHRQGGRQRRPPVRRPVRVRRRRRAGTARRWRNHGTDPRDAHGAAARARRGDEGDLDPGRGELPRRATSTSSGSGPGPSPRSGRTRRCSSAATGRRCSTACWPSATPGSRTTAAARCSSASRSCARAPTARSTSGHRRARPTRPCSSSYDEAGVAPRACTGCRRPAAAPSSAALDALGGGDRRAARRGVTPEARRASRFAAARVARLATADARRPPHLVPIVFAVDGRHRLHRGRPQAEAHDRAAAAGQRRGQPARRPARRPLRRRGLGGAVVGPRRRHARGSSTPAETRGAARRRAAGPRATRSTASTPPAGPVLAVDVARWSGWAGQESAE